jgi:hypothetical protein
MRHDGIPIITGLLQKIIQNKKWVSAKVIESAKVNHFRREA